MKKLLPILLIWMLTISSVYAVQAPTTIKPPTLTKGEAQLMSANLPQSTSCGGCGALLIEIKNMQNQTYTPTATPFMTEGGTCEGKSIAPLSVTTLGFQQGSYGVKGVQGMILFEGSTSAEVLFILAKQDRCVLAAGKNKSIVVTDIQGVVIDLTIGSYWDNTPGKIKIHLPKQTFQIGSEQGVTTSDKRTTAQRSRGVSK